jgi:hypothetical protein
VTQQQNLALLVRPLVAVKVMSMPKLERNTQSAWLQQYSCHSSRVFVFFDRPKVIIIMNVSLGSHADELAPGTKTKLLPNGVWLVVSPDPILSLSELNDRTNSSFRTNHGPQNSRQYQRDATRRQKAGTHG